MSAQATDVLKIARRYSVAMFSLACEAKKEAVLTEEMGILARAITDNGALKAAIHNPLISNVVKAELLGDLMHRADPLTRRAVDVLARAGRASLIAQVAKLLRRALAEHRGEVEAVVTSAGPLSAAVEKQLVTALGKATGKTVTLALRQDPQMLGGLCVELGSLRLDATLAGALNQLRTQLLAPTHS